MNLRPILVVDKNQNQFGFLCQIGFGIISLDPRGAPKRMVGARSDFTIFDRFGRAY